MFVCKPFISWFHHRDLQLEPNLRKKQVKCTDIWNYIRFLTAWPPILPLFWLIFYHIWSEKLFWKTLYTSISVFFVKLNFVQPWNKFFAFHEALKVKYCVFSRFSCIFGYILCVRSYFRKIVTSSLGSFTVRLQSLHLMILA